MVTTKTSRMAAYDYGVLMRLLEVEVLTYSDDCVEKFGRNLSNVNSTPMSILNLKEERSVTDLDREGSTFMWKNLLIDCILNMEYDIDDDQTFIINTLKRKYIDKPEELAVIDEFDKTYKKTDAIRWYTKQSCVFKEFNNALRISCLNIILSFRFYLKDLAAQLREEQPKFPDLNSNGIVTLYRGQGMYLEEINRLKTATPGCLISVDSFLSTSRSKDVAIGFAKPDKDKQPVLFEIKCNLGLPSKPFADISSPKFTPFPNEKEVLFMVGTIFKLQSISYDSKLQLWRLRLRLFNENNHRLAKLYKSIRDKMGQETDLLTLADLLVQQGDYEHALRVYTRSVFDLISAANLTDHGERNLIQSFMGIANVQGDLGRYDDSIEFYNEIIKLINSRKNSDQKHYQKAVAYYAKSSPSSEKGDYARAKQDCEHALAIFIKYHGYDDSNVANCYEMLGNIDGNLGRLEKTKGNINGQYQYFQSAYDYYMKALEVRQRIHRDTPDHYELSVTYVNIGELYRDMGKSDEALEYMSKAYDTFIKTFPKGHNWIAITLDNIGEIYVLQNRFAEAKEKYDEAIEVYKRTLPEDHRFIGETLHNIGKLYCCTQEHDKAFLYFNKANKIYQKKIPKDHYLARELREQIRYVAPRRF